MKHGDQKRMTNKETKALLKAVEIIIDLSPTKDDAKQYVQKIAKELEKEPTAHRPK